MRQFLVCALALPSLLALGCDPEEEVLPDDVIWVPPLTSGSGGELDFGEVAIGETLQLFITGTNNTEETITFDILVQIEAAQGWLLTYPPSWDVEPGEDISWGPQFNPSAASPSEAGGTVQFFYDNEVVTYIVSATVP